MHCDLDEHIFNALQKNMKLYLHQTQPTHQTSDRLYMSFFLQL